MRITGGKARGTPIVAPKGSGLRPATDRMREAVFSSLGARLEGVRFVDLFAGTGAYGLEAFSRGAAGGVFVEKDRSAVHCLRRNLAAVGKSMGTEVAGVTVMNRDLFAWRPGPDPRADIVFADPPYPLLPAILPRLIRLVNEILSPDEDSLFVLEGPGELVLELPGWRLVKTLGKGRGNPVCGIWERVPDRFDSPRL